MAYGAITSSLYTLFPFEQVQASLKKIAHRHAQLALLANAARRERANQRAHHRQILQAARQPLTHQVIGRVGQVVLLQGDIFPKAMEEGKFKVRSHSQRAMWADLDTIPTEDAAIQRERVARQGTLSHHQGASGTDLYTRSTRDTIGIMQAHIERCGDDGIEALAEHAITIRANHVMADPHTLRTVNALVGIPQDKAMREIHCIIMVIAGLAIMEAVIRQPMFDTLLLQVALPGSRTGALQAARRFPLGLLLQVALLDDAKIAFALLIGQHRHLHLGLHWLVGHNIEEIRFPLLQLQPTRYLLHLLLLQVSMDRASAQFALRHTFNDGLGSHLRIAAREDALAIGHKVMRIGLDRLPFRPLYP